MTDVTEIYKECDYITIHVPLLESTKKSINAEAIAMMKPTAILLNFARDLLVDEEAVVDALTAGKLARYVSDFPNSITVGTNGCIVTPHLGASTAESEDNCAKMAVKEMMDYLENGNISNSVNYPAVDMGVCQKNGRVAIFHKNVANMITKFTASFGDAGINVSDLLSKSKGEVAYTMLDVDDPATDEIVSKLEAIDGVFKVRVVK